MNINELKEFLVLVEETERKAEGLVGWDRLSLFKPLESQWREMGGRKSAVDALAAATGTVAVHDWTGSDLMSEDGMSLVAFSEASFGLNYQQGCSDTDSRDCFRAVNALLHGDKIINLTQHAATGEQVAEGVIEPASKEAVKAALTCRDIPSTKDMQARAESLAALARDSGCGRAMIGGAPYLMAPLERALMAQGIQPVYAFSVRESVEQLQPDGTTVKTSVFRHAGWVCAA